MSSHANFVAKHVVPLFRWLKTYKINKNDVKTRVAISYRCISRGHAPTVHCFRCNFANRKGGITWIRVDDQKRAHAVPRVLVDHVRADHSTFKGTQRGWCSTMNKTPPRARPPKFKINE
jgi:hypothetical protein